MVYLSLTFSNIKVLFLINLQYCTVCSIATPISVKVQNCTLMGKVIWSFQFDRKMLQSVIIYWNNIIYSVLS